MVNMLVRIHRMDRHYCTPYRICFPLRKHCNLVMYMPIT